MLETDQLQAKRLRATPPFFPGFKSLLPPSPKHSQHGNPAMSLEIHFPKMCNALFSMSKGDGMLAGIV